jgi:hypothetical protein
MTLVDVKIKYNMFDPLVLVGLTKIAERTEKGIYLGDMNFHNTLRDNGYEVEMFDSFRKRDVFNDTKPNYGVSDDIDQVLEFYKEELQNPDKNFIISYFWIHKVEEPEHGGWRWHKWGPYIGKHNITQEFIHDEPYINSVICYHIYEILKGDVL